MNKLGYDVGVSFSFDIRELVQDVVIRLRNSRAIFMCDAEPQEGGLLWAWLQSNYVSCGKIAVFVNERYLERPITRRELQFFQSSVGTHWTERDVLLFVDKQVRNSALLLASPFAKHPMESASDIADTISGQSHR